MPTQQKRCRKCKRLVAVRKLNAYLICPDCIDLWSAQNAKKRKLKEALQHAYNLITDNGYETPTCDICGRYAKTRRLNVDHDHETNEVRGLLCYRCNYVLGWFNDNAERFKRAANYLQEKPIIQLDLNIGRARWIPDETSQT